MIWLCGDTHGETEFFKVTEFFEELGCDTDITKEDYLIILGDAGIVWDGGCEDESIQATISQLPCSVLFIDGNHENFDLLEDYPISDWCGGKVHRIAEDILHLMRGQVFTIEEKHSSLWAADSQLTGISDKQASPGGRRKCLMNWNIRRDLRI